MTTTLKTTAAAPRTFSPWVPPDTPTATATAQNTVVVQEIGSVALCNAAGICSVARAVVATARSAGRVVVVVQPRHELDGGLLDLALETSSTPDGRELDMLLATREQVCMALLAMAIIESGHPAISFTGEEAGIVTSLCHRRAQILGVCPRRVSDALDRGNIVIVAGSQGISRLGEITMLEPTSPTTTAAALAAALGSSGGGFWTPGG